MVQEQAKLMLSTLTENKKAFKKFYKNGHFSYSSDENYYGEIAIVNKAIISFLASSNDESKVVATVTSQDSGTLIYKSFGKNYSFNQFGQDPTVLTTTSRVHLRKKDEVIKDIDTIRKHCAEAKEKALAIQKASSILTAFNNILVQSDNNISSQDALLLLQDTLSKLSQSRHLDEKSEQNSDLDR